MKWIAMWSLLAGMIMAGALMQGQEAGKKGSAAGDCSGPATGVEMPNAPHGLFVIMFPGARVNARANVLLHNPTVCGANFYVVWNNWPKSRSESEP